MPTDKSLNPDDMWEYTGKQRPDFAIEPQSGQESVWDYPRPPSLKVDSRVVSVKFKNNVIAQSQQSVRVLETASPPTFYLPAIDVDLKYLNENKSTSFCEWKGQASYFNFQLGNELIENVAWCYHHPLPAFESIKDYLCFYPSKLECYVDDIKVESQSSDFYGGWITPEIVGPFKGEPGTQGW